MRDNFNLAWIQKHLVDLRRSDWDKERSDPKKGRYLFADGKKVYLRLDDYKDDSTMPRYAYRWVAYDKSDDYRNMRMWQMKYSAEPVRFDDPLVEVWPEGVAPDAEGNYRYMDLILMRVPTEVWVDKLIDDKAVADSARKNLDKRFREEAKEAGAEVDEADLPVSR